MISSVSLPPPVAPGARVGVAALSGSIDAARLERGLAELRRLGFEPVLADNLASRHLLFAGSDEERLAAFHRLASDPDLPAILFARGGSGLLRLLDRVDWDLLASRPRAYVGYSDLTPFLLEVVRRLGLAAFHGPMVAADLARSLTAREEASLLGALAGRVPLEVPVAEWVRPGEAEGPLLGGCLTMIDCLLGTPYAPDLEGAVLFWEELNEPVFRLDRLLTHLWLSGRLASVRGMILGHLACPELTAEDWRTWRRLLEEWGERLNRPVGVGLPVGHLADNLTLPLGLPARLDPASGLLRVG